MKTIRWAMIALLSISAFAADAPPTPIPAERMEAISRQVIQQQQAQLSAQQATIALLDARLAQIDAEARAREAEQKSAALVASLQKEFRAAGCNLSVEKEWKCPAPAK
ncbi:hypothetical protein UFOVP130_51 [uncultured Caudovirales phage]|uniref:Uncharacterized protein n=1 Tax=uncultured Caudovirales phage TaxID=2100421 RepID=A0A6J5L8H4_9CAUD|nr:hypothetical protein UFOVP130_51 [uncultured Caudovirales phage]